MKAFIFVALVATVAARSLDLETLRQVNQVNKEKFLTNKLVGDDLLKEHQLKELKKNLHLGQEHFVDSTVYPVEQTFDNVNVDRVLSIQELYSTELYREFLNLPLFRQYIQYPSFQRFVGSVYFQRFWQLPAYKQYFINSVLFYKYIYPIVQLFHSEYTQYTLPTVYGQHEDVLGLQTLVDDVQNKHYLPYAYNYNRYTVPTNYGFQPTNYKFLLEKLYKSLYNTHQQPITEVKTDIKLIPEKVVVEPITHQEVVVEEPKIVDVKVEKQIVPAVDSIVPYTTTTDVVLTERHHIILKDLLQQNIITPEIYQAVVVGKYDFVTVIRQVLEHRGFTTDLTHLFVNRLVAYDSVVPTLLEKDILLVKELLRQHIITPEVYQAVLVGKYDFFTLLRQVIIRRDVIDSVYPVVDTGVLSERKLAILKQLLRHEIISQEIYEAVVLGKVEFRTVLRQVLERRGITSDLISLIIRRFVVDYEVPVSTEQDVYLLRELYRQNIITSEIYQAVVYGKLDVYTVLRQIIFRRDVVDTVVPYTNRFDRFSGNDRFDFINKYYGYKYNKYTTDIPTYNTYNRDSFYNRDNTYTRDNIYNRDTTFYGRYPTVA